MTYPYQPIENFKHEFKFPEKELEILNDKADVWSLGIIFIELFNKISDSKI